MQQQQEYDEFQIGTDATLYDRYASAIFGYIRLHTHTCEDAEDLTLEVFTIALERHNLEEMAERDKLIWLRRVAHNKLIDLYRRYWRHPVVTLEQVEESIYLDQAATPEQLALQRERDMHLYQKLKCLPTLQQHLLHLRYGRGLHFAEIAILLNKREAAVRKLLSRTLSTLRTIYEQEREELTYDHY